MMHESLFTFAVEKLGRIGLPGPALSLAIMMLCGQNQQLPLPGTHSLKLTLLLPGKSFQPDIQQGRVKEGDHRILYKDSTAIRSHISDSKSMGEKDSLALFSRG